MRQVALMRGGRESPRMGRRMLAALPLAGGRPSQSPSLSSRPETAWGKNAGTPRYVLIPQWGSGRTVKSGRRHICLLTSLGRRDCHARPDSSLEVKRVVLWPRGLTQNTATAPSRAVVRTRSAGTHTKPTR